MTAEERFNNFYTALMASNPTWADGLPLVFPNKDMRLAAKKVWLGLHSEGKIKKPELMDWKEARQWLQKELTWQEPKNSDGFEKAVPVEIHPKALTGEARAKRIQEFLEAINKVGNPETQRCDPYKTVREQWTAPDGEVYHPNVEAGIMADLRREYGRLHTDKISGKPLPGSPTFEEWVKEKQQEK